VKLPALQGKAAALLLEMTLQVVEAILLGVRLKVVPLLLVGHLQMVPLQVFALQVEYLRLVPLLVGHLQVFALQAVSLRLVPLMVVLHLPELLRLNMDYRVVPRTELSLSKMSL
jgi:hypothetical protein